MDLTTETVSIGIPVEIESHCDGRHIAASIILPGCVVVGKSTKSALARFKFAAEDWIDAAIDRSNASRLQPDREPEPPTP